LRVQWVAGAWLLLLAFKAFNRRDRRDPPQSTQRDKSGIDCEIGAADAEKHLQYLANKVNIKRTALAIIAAVLVGFPAGWIFAMALTPLLWRLEPVFHMELAGHSGPSDWIFYLVWAFVIPGLFFVFRQRLSRRADKL